jgi:hypothetical protein
MGLTCQAYDEHTGGQCGNGGWTVQLVEVEGALTTVQIPLCAWHRWTARHDDGYTIRELETTV